MSSADSNMLTDEYGSVIRITEKDVMDSLNPRWTYFTTEGTPPIADYYQAYMLDPDDPLAFWLFPLPQPCQNVIITYAGIPPAVTTVEDELAVGDQYVSAIANYVVYRALMKESRAGESEIAMQYRNSFLSELGAYRQVVRTLPEHKNRAPDAEA